MVSSVFWCRPAARRPIFCLFHVCSFASPSIATEVSDTAPDLPYSPSGILGSVISSHPPPPQFELPSANQPSLDPTVPLYAERFKASLRNLRKFSSPTVIENGVPVVQDLTSVMLKTINLWKDHIMAQFPGLISPLAKIFHDINKGWGLVIGKQRMLLFYVFPYSPDGSLEISELKSTPTWEVLKNVLPQMYSLDGINVIASVIGEPLHTEKSKLDPFHFGNTKFKVEISLDLTPPEVIVDSDELCQISENINTNW